MTTQGSPQTTQVLELLRWLLIAVFVVIGWMTLSFLAKILAPILAALGIAYLLNPVLERLVRRGVPRTLGAGLLLITFVALILGAVIAAIPAVANQIGEFVHDLPRLMANLDVWLHDHFGMTLPDDWRHYLTKENLENTFGAEGPLRQLATAALGGIFTLLAVIAEFLLVPVFAFYFLVDWPNLLRRIDHMIPAAQAPRRARSSARSTASSPAGFAVRRSSPRSSRSCTRSASGPSGCRCRLPIGLLVGALTVIPFVGTSVGAAIAALVTVANGSSFENSAWSAASSSYFTCSRPAT